MLNTDGSCQGKGSCPEVEQHFPAVGSFLHSACGTPESSGISSSALKWGLVITSQSPRHPSRCIVVKDKHFTHEKCVAWCLEPAECSALLVIIRNGFSTDVPVNGLYDAVCSYSESFYWLPVLENGGKALCVIWGYMRVYSFYT